MKLIQFQIERIELQIGSGRVCQFRIGRRTNERRAKKIKRILRTAATATLRLLKRGSVGRFDYRTRRDNTHAGA